MQTTMQTKGEGWGTRPITVAEAEAWREHTTGPFEMRVFAGGHFYLNRHATEVVELIRRRITHS